MRFAACSRPSKVIAWKPSSPSRSPLACAAPKYSACVGKTSTWTAAPSRSATASIESTACIIVRAGTKTEAGDERTIVLPQSIVQSLSAHRTRQLETKLQAGPRWQGLAYPNATPTGYVFTSSTGTIMDPRNLNRYFAKVRQKANLPTHTFHQLRHDCASLLLAQGIPLWAVSKILGHSGIQITANIYGHLATELQWDAADRMDILLGSMTAPRQ
jgi:integrase